MQAPCLAASNRGAERILPDAASLWAPLRSLMNLTPGCRSKRVQPCVSANS